MQNIQNNLSGIHSHDPGLLQNFAITGSVNSNSQITSLDEPKVEVNGSNHLVRLIKRLSARRNLSMMSMLEVGCGTGHFAIPLAQNLNGMIVVGTDRSKQLIELARGKNESHLVIWEEQEPNALTFDPESFDIVFVSNILDRFEFPMDVIRQCTRVLKPGGILINHYGIMPGFPDCNILVESYYGRAGIGPMKSVTRMFSHGFQAITTYGRKI